MAEILAKRSWVICQDQTVGALDGFVKKTPSIIHKKHTLQSYRTIIGGESV